ncbi:hypothetical protein BD779DRAFT_1033520 [Infundibulicybe gibba]|nr:hypothetical protein BD779DRAFT_1033520 [Infundibulicybe gibba]
MIQSPSMEDLPVEIIRAIFLQLCSQPAIFPLGSQDEPRLLVTQVCSQWRTIALSTPDLWADYYIYFLQSDSLPQSGPIRAWISRAAQSPLSLTLRGSDRYFDTSPVIIDLVFPLIHRCSFLDLHLNTAMLDQLLALPPSSFHALQSATFIIEDMSQRAAGPTLFSTALETCTQLHTFSFKTIGHRYPENFIANFNVPWHQLTTLRLHSSSILAHKCLDILRQCTSLRECSVFISYINDFVLQRIVEHSRHPIVLPLLHTLCVKFLDRENRNCHFLWHALYLPCLRKFQPMGSQYEFALWSLPNFQSVLCDTIEELDLSKFKFPECLPETLALVPNVKILWLGDISHKYPGAMRALGEGTLSPHLTTLYLRSVENFDFLFDIMEMRIAAARADRGISVFVKITVLNRGIDPLDKDRLRGLAEAGVRIQFGYPG